MIDIYLTNVSRRNPQIQLPIWACVLKNSLKLHGLESKIIDLTPIREKDREDYFKNTIRNKQAIYGFSITAGNNHLTENEKSFFNP